MLICFFCFQAEDGIRDYKVTGVQTCALPISAVYKTAESVGVDVDRLKRDMAAPEIARALKANTELADALDIRGTPGFIVGNEIVPGAIDLASLKQLIATARKK